MSTENARDYSVVVNDEGQYSIWPVDRVVPVGWREEGSRGPKELCLSWIEETWTDMRPLSVRQAEPRPAGEVKSPAYRKARGTGT